MPMPEKISESTTATLSLPDRDEPQDHSLTVVEVQGQEGMSDLFHYVVQAHSDDGRPLLDEAQPNVGESIQLMFHRPNEGTRSVTGIIARVVEHADPLGSDQIHYEINIRPRLWRLTLSRHYRTFTDRKIIQEDDGETGVLETLLQDVGYSTDEILISLDDAYAEQSHLVQHGETDFAFFQRLVSESGVAYFLDGNDAIHLIDRSATDRLLLYKRAADDGMGTSASLRPATQRRDQQEGRLLSYALERNTIPKSISAYDSRPGTGRFASGSVGVDEPGATGSIHEYPSGLGRSNNYAFSTSASNPWTQGPALQVRREDQLRSAYAKIRGETNARLLGIGMVFEMEEAYCPSVVRQFQTTSSTNTHSQSVLPVLVQRLRVSLTQGIGYRAEVEAHPLQAMQESDNKTTEAPNIRGPRFTEATESENEAATSAYQLKTTPHPGPRVGTMAGVHLGEVQDVSSRTESQRKFAMVKVRLDANTDTGQPGDATVWARVMSFGGGRGSEWGTQWIPREGAKVVVAYPEGSDGTSPIVLGTLMNYHQTSPFYQEGDLTKISGLRTRSDRGDDGVVHNEIRFKDEKHKEEVRISAPHNRTEFTGLQKDVDEKRTYHKRSFDTVPDNYVPHPRQYITPKEWSELPQRSDKICRLDPYILEIAEEYEATDDPPQRLSYAEWQKLNDETLFRLRTEEELEGEIKAFRDGVEALRDKAECQEITLAQFEGKVPVDGKQITESSYAEDPPRAFRKAYALQSVGKNAYLIEPHQEMYGADTVERVMGASGDNRRVHYAAGGTLEACEGTYRIHSFGDRLEICRKEAGNDGDVIDQDASEDWEMPRLPNKLQSFRKENPILILSKDGSIVLQSKKGISLQSEGDVNIQSGGSVNLDAKSNVNVNAGSSIELKSNILIDFLSNKIDVGDGDKTNQITMAGKIFKKETDQDIEDAQIWENETKLGAHELKLMGSEEVGLVNSLVGVEQGSTILSFNVIPGIGIGWSVLDVGLTGIEATQSLAEVESEALKTWNGGVQAIGSGIKNKYSALKNRIAALNSNP